MMMIRDINWDLIQGELTTTPPDECEGIICINHYCYSISDWEAMTQEDRDKYCTPDIIDFTCTRVYRKKKRKLKVYKMKKI